VTFGYSIDFCDLLKIQVGKTLIHT